MIIINFEYANRLGLTKVFMMTIRQASLGFWALTYVFFVFGQRRSKLNKRQIELVEYVGR